ncbi:NRDE family protein [Halorubrum salinarum]|uniref:NRDE family protein n=1 Tax=Halorubrum salinarum TaxID=2739057 RepID=A0A7D4BZ87_9EURY|nr:NRDE family protein [Halorubrum salinarum]QKG91556.1 NRDE family protein [Halorubrum salinarum]
MCTLTLAWRTFGDAPVALAATRDEALDRPSEPPAVRGATSGDGGRADDGGRGTDGDAGGRVRYVAPRDAEAGGTWIGVSEGGLVVAVTNRWLDADREGDRSRGLLVRDCLTAPSAEAAVRAVERELDERDYDGFNLVLADERAAFLLAYDGGLAATRLDPGVHVVGNVGGVVNGTEQFAVPERRRAFGEERADSARRIAAALVPEPGESGASWLDRASGVLADHEYGACLHGDSFGTRSFTRIRTGDAPEMAYADGPPCETPAEPVSLPADFAVGDD